MSDTNQPAGIAGTGRIAQALGRLLRERGERIVAVAGRTPELTETAAIFIGGEAKPVTFSRLPGCVKHILIAVSDDAISQVAEMLAESGMTSGAVLHTSGARGIEVLAALQTNGVACGTLHPLQTIAGPRQGLAALPGAAYAISGDTAAAEWAGRIVRLLGGNAIRIPEDRRKLYHSAAVMASNYVVALIDAAVILMDAAGIAKEQALKALGPLVRTSVENALNMGTDSALTGPIARGDAETISGHLRALREAPVTIRTLYGSVGLQALDIALRRGLPDEKARELKELLEGAIRSK